jgi:hypothetical protein
MGATFVEREVVARLATFTSIPAATADSKK